MLELKQSPELRGPEGPRGLKGDQGLQGDAGVVDYEKLAAEIMARLPPITVRTVDNDGSVKDSVAVKLGGTLNLNHTYTRAK